MEDLQCRELVELVTDYLEGRLPPVDRLRFDEHLKGCTGCRTYLDQMRTTIRSLGLLSEETIEPKAKEDLLRVFRTWKQS